MKKMTYPADYAVLSNEEMTYTTGGGTIDDAAGIATTAATVVGAVVLASSYVWGIGQARTWLQQEGNRDGNFFTVLGRHHGSGTGSPERHPADRALSLLIR